MLASDVSAPLLPSILSQAIDLPAPPNFDVVPPSQASSASQTQPYSVGEKKIPKWMQAAMSKLIILTWHLFLISSQERNNAWA